MKKSILLVLLYRFSLGNLHPTAELPAFLNISSEFALA